MQQEQVDIILNSFKEGRSKEYVLRKLDISRKEHAEKLVCDDDYAEAWEKGELELFAYWHDLLRDVCAGKIKGSNATVVIWATKNILNFKDDPKQKELDKTEKEEFLAKFRKEAKETKDVNIN